MVSKNIMATKGRFAVVQYSFHYQRMADIQTLGYSHITYPDFKHYPCPVMSIALLNALCPLIFCIKALKALQKSCIYIQIQLLISDLLLFIR